MGLFTKHEKYSRESGRFEPVEKKDERYETLRNEQTGESVRVSREEKPLTREEQFKPRQQPWKTERGKRVIKSMGSGVKRIDKAVVNYNRTRNIMYRQPTRRQPRQSISNYSTHDNYNPFGNMFDTGMTRPSSHKKKSKAKYTIVKGKAYPIAGTGKKKKSRKKTRSSKRSNDPFNAFGGIKF